MIKLILFVSLIKEVIFSAVIPMWHTPDEQAHFAQVAYFSEFGKMPHYPDDLNKEILISEKLLGTERNEQGVNKFTFHPEYRIEYTNSLIGKYEEEIRNLPKSYRTELVKQESANYPPLYYLLSSIAYRLFYDGSIIDRVFLARALPVFMSVGIVWVSFLLAKHLFPKNSVYQATLPLMVSFHPMLSFVGAGINSDNLMNLLFPILLLLCILIIKSGITSKKVLASVLIIILMFLTKPQYILALPVFAVAIIISIFLHKKRKILTFILGFLAAGLIALLFYLKIDKEYLLKLERMVYVQSFYQNVPPEKISLQGLITFFRQTIEHTFREVFPWYWGVFNWLGVTYPRIVHQVINRVTVLAAVGFSIKAIGFLNKRTIEDYLVLFLTAGSLIYFLGITFYNYLFYLGHSFPFGIQGRYYFPLITAHMSILLAGLLFLIPKKLSFISQNISPKVIGVLMIVLNFIAIWTIAKSYYDLSSIQTALNQISQYKPWFFKGYMLILWFGLYLVSILILLFRFLKFKVGSGIKSVNMIIHED